MENILIRNEDDAWGLLKDIIEENLPAENFQICFENWPRFHIILTGDKYNSTITTKVMESFIEIQKSINRTYANLKYDRPLPQLLSDEDKRDLELVVQVKPGSTDLIGLIDGPLSKMAEGVVTNMDGHQTMMAILGCGLLFAFTVCFKAYVQKQKETKDSDTLIALSDKETECMKIFSEAINRSQRLALIRTEAEETYNSVLKGTSSANVVNIGDFKLEQPEVKEILRPVKSKSAEVQLNGEYRVLAIDNKKTDFYKVDLQYGDGRLFSARLEDKFLATKEQNRALIENALWQRTPIFLIVNGTELRGEVTQATIIDVRDRYIRGMHDV